MGRPPPPLRHAGARAGRRARPRGFRELLTRAGAAFRTVGNDSRPEPPLTPLGLSHRELAQALGRYRLQLHGLIHALVTTAPGHARPDALQALDELTSKLEVDLGARRTSAGRERMSSLECDVLVPLLERLHRQVAALARAEPMSGWLAALRAADDDVARVERALAHP